MRLADVTDPYFAIVGGADPVALVREILRPGRDHAAVMEEGEIVGILAAEDLEGAADADPVSRVMRTSFATLPPSATLIELAAVMLGGGHDAVCVVDGGCVVGVLTMADVFRLVGCPEVEIEFDEDFEPVPV